MMGYRKSTLGVFLACIGLFSGYVIKCDSLKLFRSESSHDTLNLSHDLTRKSVLSTGICNNKTYSSHDEYTELALLMHVDFNDTIVPCQMITLYGYIFVLIRQYCSFDIRSRNGCLNTKQNPDLCTTHITEIGTTLECTKGRSEPTHMSDENTNRLDSFSVDNETLHNSQKPYLKLDQEAFELKSTIKLSVILVFVLTRLLWMVLRNVPRFFNKIVARTVKWDTPNSTHYWRLLKCFFESSNSLTDQLNCYKNNNSDTTKTYRGMKKVLEDTISALSPPVQDIVVAPVTELNDYIETMSNLVTSNIDVSLNIEILRIESFRNFPRSSPVSTIRLAENGFFHTGKSDEAECFHCHVRYSGWKRGDTPSEIHKKISPDCDFVRGMETVNVPLLQPSRHVTTLERACRDACGPPQIGNVAKVSDDEFRSEKRSGNLHSNTGSKVSHIVSHGNIVENERHNDASYSNTNDPAFSIINGEQRNAPSEESRVLEHKTGGEERSDRDYHQQLEFNGRKHEKHNFTGNEGVKIKCLDENNTNQTDWRTKDSGKLRLIPLAYVRKTLMYPAYAIPTIRLSSYKGWSSTSGLNPRSLSDAGFIYAGYGDQVRCFCCGGALRNWLSGDDPWIEHAKWYPECVFLRQSKGDSFIYLVHDDVKLPQMIGHNKSITPKSATGDTGYEDLSPVSENVINCNPDPVGQSLEEPFTQRVKAMGFSMDTISSSVTSLQRQGMPIDTFNILNEILCSETISERVGLDEIDSFQTTKQTLHGNSRQVQGTEKRTMQTKNTCKICLGEDACVMFLPCHHTVCCKECGPVLHRCPVCRQVIKGRLET